MKHIFSFKEINHGSVIINCDHTPDNDEVIDAIMNGDAYYKDTEYGDVRLIETDNSTSRNERIYEQNRKHENTAF